MRNFKLTTETNQDFLNYMLGEVGIPADKFNAFSKENQEKTLNILIQREEERNSETFDGTELIKNLQFILKHITEATETSNEPESNEPAFEDDFDANYDAHKRQMAEAEEEKRIERSRRTHRPRRQPKRISESLRGCVENVGILARGERVENLSLSEIKSRLEKQAAKMAASLEERPPAYMDERERILRKINRELESI